MNFGSPRYTKTFPITPRNPQFIDKIKKNLNCYYGRAYEKVAREFLVTKLGLFKAHRQWGKIPTAAGVSNGAYEIDLIGVNGKGSYAFEFKWEELEYMESLRILNQLKEKAKYVPKLPPDVQFGLVAKKINQKDRLCDLHYLVYDLDDF